MYDLIIIGAGPAGTAAAVYAARKKLKTLLISEELGGQSIVSETIYNWIGSPEIAGDELAKSFKSHLDYYVDNIILSLKIGEKVTHIEKENDSFSIKTTKENIYKSKTVLVVSGSKRKKLSVPGSDELEHKGLTYCASCDGPLFTDMDVVVVGGGNAGFESAAQLSAYCKSVTILQRSSEYRADAMTVEKILSKENVHGITNTNITKITGENFVDGIDFNENEEHKHIEAKGIFVEIGQNPNSEMVSGLVELNQTKHIIIDPWTQKTSCEGVWAAGDVTNVLYHQNNISAGDATKALENIYQYIHTHK